jgi:hypothetical protein
MMLELLTSHDDQDLCFRESGHLQQQQNQAVVSTSILQSRTTAKCNQVHDGSLLSWSVLVYPQARSDRSLDKTFGSLSSSSDLSVVCCWSDDYGTV